MHVLGSWKGFWLSAEGSRSSGLQRDPKPNSRFLASAYIGLYARVARTRILPGLGWVLVIVFMAVRNGHPKFAHSR